MAVQKKVRIAKSSILLNNNPFIEIKKQRKDGTITLKEINFPILDTTNYEPTKVLKRHTLLCGYRHGTLGGT